MIINSHVHVSAKSTSFFYYDYGIRKLLTEMQGSGIDIAFPCLNPKLSIFRCPNDCSFSCTQMHGKVNNNLNNCACLLPNRHRVCVHQKDKKLVFSCRTCGKLILETSIDPLRKYNIDLINLTKPYRSFIKPILYVSLCKATLQREIQFFEENFPEDFVGFKFHPWNDQVSVAGFKVNTSRPILIHTGKRSIESAKNAITFAKNNPSVQIVIAHAAALDTSILKEIAKMENVFIDCCPSVFMFGKKSSFFDSPQALTCPEAIYYRVLEFVPSNRILFGSDSPWGNTMEELSVIRRLKIPSSAKSEILYKNAERLYLAR